MSQNTYLRMRERYKAWEGLLVQDHRVRQFPPRDLPTSPPTRPRPWPHRAPDPPDVDDTEAVMLAIATGQVDET